MANSPDIITSSRLSIANSHVDALARDGTEYQMFYKSDFDLFEHLLPIVENMF